MFKTIHIKKHERGLLFREGDFVRLLGTRRFAGLDAARLAAQRSKL